LADLVEIRFAEIAVGQATSRECALTFPDSNWAGGSSALVL
jgi:hypothetical protein